jgi:hypothetical protein
MSWHGYKVGDRVRMLSGDHEGEITLVVEAELPDYDGEQPVRVALGWWPIVGEFERVEEPTVGAKPHPTGEAMGLAHAKAWRLFTAKTPREWLLATGWAVGDTPADWVHEDGHSIRFEYGVADVYDFESGPDDESPLGWTTGLDSRTLRSLADLLDEHNGVTP